MRPLTPKPQMMVWSCKVRLQLRSRYAVRVRSASTSSVVDTRMTRNSTLAGITTSTFTSRAPSLTGVMSP